MAEENRALANEGPDPAPDGFGFAEFQDTAAMNREIEAHISRHHRERESRRLAEPTGIRDLPAAVLRSVHPSGMFR